MNKKYLWLLLLLIPLIFTIIFKREPVTIIVPDDYSSIQHAIDNARNGDTVIVTPGSYFESINFKGKRITVASRFYTEQDTSYISRTIINGNNKVPNVVLFENNETSKSRLIGFTITGGNAVGTEPRLVYTNGGGINALRTRNSSPPLVSHCIIRDNKAVQGGGVFYAHPLRIEHTQIFNNTALEVGGGIFAITPYFGEIVNCEIHSNIAQERGGGAHLLGGSHLIKDSYIHNNTASDYEGGGLFLHFGTVTVKNSVIVNNRSVNGGGLCISGPSKGRGKVTNKIYLVNSTISNNYSQPNKSAIFIKRGAIGVFVNSIIHNNHLKEIAFSDEEAANTLIVAYSNIKGGQDGIEPNDNGEVQWLEGNIDADPLFVDAENDDFRLAESSPCRNAGTSSFTYERKEIVKIAEYNGATPNMGAYQ